MLSSKQPTRATNFNCSTIPVPPLFSFSHTTNDCRSHGDRVASRASASPAVQVSQPPTANIPCLSAEDLGGFALVIQKGQDWFPLPTMCPASLSISASATRYSAQSRRRTRMLIEDLMYISSTPEIQKNWGEFEDGIVSKDVYHISATCLDSGYSKEFRERRKLPREIEQAL